MRSAYQPTVILPLVPTAVDDELGLEADGHGRPIDMVLSAKLSDMKASSTVRGFNNGTLH